MDLNGRAVSHSIFEVRAGGQIFKHTIENIGLHPTAKPLDDRVPIAKIIGQVTLLRTASYNPVDGLHAHTRVASGLAGIARSARAMLVR